MTPDPSRGSGRRTAIGSWVALAAAAAMLAGCSSADEDDAPASAARTSPSIEATQVAAGFPANPPAGFCEDLLVELAPVNADTVEYATQGHKPGDRAAEVSGRCDIDPTQVPSAAAEGLDVVVLRLTFADAADLPPSQNVDDWPRLDGPVDSADTEPYVTEQWHDPLRGELKCWDVPECDTGGDIDGQVFTYEFAAVHQNVVLTAQVRYLSPDVSDEVATRARQHASDVYAGYAAAVAAALEQ